MALSTKARDKWAQIVLLILAMLVLAGFQDDIAHVIYRARVGGDYNMDRLEQDYSEDIAVFPSSKVSTPLHFKTLAGVYFIDENAHVDLVVGDNPARTIEALPLRHPSEANSSKEAIEHKPKETLTPQDTSALAFEIPKDGSLFGRPVDVTWKLRLFHPEMVDEKSWVWQMTPIEGSRRILIGTREQWEAVNRAMHDARRLITVVEIPLMALLVWLLWRAFQLTTD